MIHNSQSVPKNFQNYLKQMMRESIKSKNFVSRQKFLDLFKINESLLQNTICQSYSQLGNSFNIKINEIESGQFYLNELMVELFFKAISEGKDFFLEFEQAFGMVKDNIDRNFESYTMIKSLWIFQKTIYFDLSQQLNALTKQGGSHQQSEVQFDVMIEMQTKFERMSKRNE